MNERNSGQTNIDFVIAITVFVAAVFFAVQFVGSTASAFLEAGEETPIEAHSASDRLVNHELATSDGPQGELELTQFLNASGGVKTESELSEELSLDADGIYLTVTESKTGDTIKVNGQNITVGGGVPDGGTKVSKVTRIGYTQTNGTVIINLRMW